MSNPTANWDKLGDRYYRKITFYNEVLDGEIELQNYHVCAAPFGGAIALYQKEDGIHQYVHEQTAQSSIDIYGSSGKQLRRITWNGDSIVGLGWSEDETLVVISRDGAVRCYSNLEDGYIPFSLGDEASTESVVGCRFWHTGFVALLGNNTLVAVTSYREPRPKLLAIPPQGTVISWTIIPPASSSTRSVEALLSIDTTIYVVDSTEAEDRLLQNGPFKHMNVSPNGKLLALYTDGGKLWIISSDFQDKLSDHETGVKTPPKDMQWCGNDSLLLAWDDEVHMVGPNVASVKYVFDSPVRMLPDVDGVRLLTAESCEFLQRVPYVTEDIFKMASESPAAILLDAISQLDKRSPKADDDIQLIRPDLVDAVDFCIEAAGYEFDRHWQRRLLRAASFGKSALELYDADNFVAMTETVRILNTMRFHEVGLPLTYDQYVSIGPERLVQRLLNRQAYTVALKLSEKLMLSKNIIYEHWASQKVRRSTAADDQTTHREILEKLEGIRGISFERIATVAFEEGRQTLATDLLNHEARAAQQVPLLLIMEKDLLALDKAIDSGDMDLVLYVLLQYKQKVPLATFFRTINARPVASAIVESTAVIEDREILKDLYYQDDRRFDSFDILFQEALALTRTDMPATINKLKTASKVLQDTKEVTFQARGVDDMQKLLRIQAELDTETQNRNREAEEHTVLLGMSVNKTIFELIKTGNSKRAQRMQSDFKVSEKTFWWIRLRALVRVRNFRELEEIAARNKKSPIGWEPFFNEVIAAGNTKLAAIFVAKCTTQSPHERAEMYVKCAMISKAGEEALRSKDLKLLEELRGKASGAEALEIERMIGVLSKSK